MSTAARSHSSCAFRSGGSTIIRFPARPPVNILSETIPLFYIARGRRGFWVAREAQGRSGGIFLLRRSAMRFARRQSAPSGCAMMFLNAPLDLDIHNQGGDLVEKLVGVMAYIGRRAPILAAFVAMAIAEWSKLLDQLSQAAASERRNRAALERELFDGRHVLCSKNDDDLPIL